MRPSLRHAAVGCHLVLAVALVVAILAPALSPPRVAGALVVLVPLLATLPGLVNGSAAGQRWLAAALVPYIGGLSMEVVAREGAAPLLGVALLAAVAELGALVALSRRPSTARE